ncbi:upf0400 protein [Acrodontium crateriforme]|uniref:Upf0400 protein n=1 Tax=Acrodontium crateriforme TaxID=150365 RepID=A0AAQ3M7A4_9PEZI|nr:upf0400 protein [Acrodontium crateriforme]
MAYSDDAVQAKLNSLNESQDSIVANAQWIMFHRRHADRTAGIWLTRMQEATMPKRLNLIYLANEVVQQSRARGKQDFMVAFEPIIADATALAYKGASQDVQGKLRRVVDVWRQRNIFDKTILQGVEQRLTELDKQRVGKSGGSGRLGGNLFGGPGSGPMPTELDGVSKALGTLTRAELLATPAATLANGEYSKITDPDATLPTPPVYAARLSAVMKELATAQGAVEASIKARKELLTGLEALVESNRAKLAAEESTLSELSSRKEYIESKKREVEDGIMRGLSAPSTPGLSNNADLGQTNGDRNGRASIDEPERPEAEGFTPPPPDVEAFTPPTSDETGLTGDPAPLFGDKNIVVGTTGADIEQAPNAHEFPPQQDFSSASAAANDFMNNFSSAPIRQASTEYPEDSTGDGDSDPRLKRRKMSHKSAAEDDIFGSGEGAGIDEDGITAMLG